MQYFTIQQSTPIKGRKSVVIHAIHDDAYKTIITITGPDRSNVSFNPPDRQVEAWDALEETLQTNTSLRDLFEKRMEDAFGHLN